MEYVNSSSPFASVVKYGKETFVSIRQLSGGNENIQQQGIIVTLKQFSLLMYHLKAIETSLVNGRNESTKKETNEFISTLIGDPSSSSSSSSSSSNVDYSRTKLNTLTEVNMNDQMNNTELTSYEEMEAAINYIPNNKDVINSGGTEAKLPTQRKRIDKIIPEHEAKLPKQRKQAMLFTPIRTVREELMQIYCELFEEQFPNMIMKKCSGVTLIVANAMNTMYVS